MSQQKPFTSLEHCMPDPNTYDICINEYQRQLLIKGMNYMLMSLQGTGWTDPAEETAAKEMRTLLVSDLSPTGLNSFVL